MHYYVYEKSEEAIITQFHKLVAEKQYIIPPDILRIFNDKENDTIDLCSDNEETNIVTWNLSKKEVEPEVEKEPLFTRREPKRPTEQNNNKNESKSEWKSHNIVAKNNYVIEIESSDDENDVQETTSTDDDTEIRASLNDNLERYQFSDVDNQSQNKTGEIFYNENIETSENGSTDNSNILDVEAQPLHPAPIAKRSESQSALIERIDVITLQNLNLKDPRVRKHLPQFVASPLISAQTRQSIINYLSEYQNSEATSPSGDGPSLEHNLLKAQQEEAAKQLLETMRKTEEAQKAIEAECKSQAEMLEAERKAKVAEGKEIADKEASKRKAVEREAKEIADKETSERKRKEAKEVTPIEMPDEHTSNEEHVKLRQNEKLKLATDKTEGSNIAKTNRVLKDLEGTVNGFNNISDYISKTIGGKRRSSICARAAIASQYNAPNSDLNETSSNESVAVNVTANDFRKKKTRRATLASQLNYSDQEENASNDRSSVESVKNSSRTVSPSSDSNKVKETEATFSTEKVPVLPIRRMSQRGIERFYKSKENEMPVHNSPEKKKYSAPHKSKAVPGMRVQKQTISIYNTDETMREDNTSCCILCMVKPVNLTSHYIGRHKLESYVSRLSNVIIAKLQMNTPFALVSQTLKHQKKRIYETRCAICCEELIDTFLGFYDHYSKHTGEFAYQCGGCKYLRPFRADIQSHIRKAKNCHKARVRIVYLYSENQMVIYLFYCDICNFMQLNEANIYKHLRDHHLNKSDDPELVNKCILTAIKDSDTDDSSSACSILDLPDDAGIAVHNEPICNENIPTSVINKMEELFGSDSDVEIQPGVIYNRTTFQNPPMTVVHSARHNENQFINTEQPKNMISSQEMPSLKQKVSLVETRNMPPPIVVKVENEFTDASIEPETHNEVINETNEAVNTVAGVVNVENECTDTSIEPETHKEVINDTNEAVHTSPSDNLQDDPREIHPKVERNTARKSYRCYPKGVAYFGLYKCMGVDCIYSTDRENEFLEHIREHGNSNCPPSGILECAYCLLDKEDCNDAEMLATHIRQKHIRNRYQCPNCCYRGRLSGNVELHRMLAHSGDDVDNIVYECSSSDTDNGDGDNNAYILRSQADNVGQLVCKECQFECYALSTMEDHLEEIHKRRICANDNFNAFSCIYCSTDMNSIEELKFHLALNHPDEVPYMCARMLNAGLEEDTLANLLLNDLRHTVSPESIVAAPCERANNAVNAEHTENLLECEDIKPTSANLLKTCEETIKPLLLKVTQDTGVSPDRLFHCPQPNCGGFFTIFELWKRHLKLRHKTNFAKCPHCPNNVDLLELHEFKEHLKTHRRHLFVCYYCGHSFKNDVVTREHILSAHISELHSDNALHLANIPISMSYSYHVVSGTDAGETDRLQFLLKLHEVLENRKKQLQVIEEEKIVAKWTASAAESTWLSIVPIRNLKENTRKLCIQSSCQFYTTDLDELFTHLIADHTLSSSIFKCLICKDSPPVDHIQYPFIDWWAIFSHIKLHSTQIVHICCICCPKMCMYTDWKEIRAHVAEKHNLRDTPVVTIERSHQNQHQVSVCFVFTSSLRTFSLQKCFCCRESPNLNMSTFVQHLKRTHNLKLRYFCNQCDEPLPVLQDAELHSQTMHPNETLKVRCQLATNCQLNVTSLQPLCIEVQQVERGVAKRMRSVVTGEALNGESAEPLRKIPKVDVKQEIDIDSDNEDSVILMEHDDCVIEDEYIACRNKKQAQISLKCININNLMKSTQPVNVPRFCSPKSAIGQVEANSSAHTQTNAYNEQEVSQQVSRQQRAVTDHAQPSKQKLFRLAMPPPVNVPRFRSTESAVGQVESNSSVRAQTQRNAFNESEVLQQVSRQQRAVTDHAQPSQQTVYSSLPMQLPLQHYGTQLSTPLVNAPRFLSTESAVGQVEANSSAHAQTNAYNQQEVSQQVFGQHITVTNRAQPSQQTVHCMPIPAPVNVPRFCSRETAFRPVESNNSVPAQTQRNAFNEQEVSQQVPRQQRAVTDHAQPSTQTVYRLAMTPSVNVPRFRSTESAVGQVESNSSVRAQTQTNTFNEQEVSQQVSRQEVVLTSHAQPSQRIVWSMSKQLPLQRCGTLLSTSLVNAPRFRSTESAVGQVEANSSAHAQKVSQQVSRQEVVLTSHAQASQRIVYSMSKQLPLQRCGTLLSTPLVNAPRFRSTESAVGQVEANSSAHAQTNTFNEQEVSQQVFRQQIAVTNRAQPSQQTVQCMPIPPPVNVQRFCSRETAVGPVESNSSVRAQTQRNEFNEQEVPQQVSRQQRAVTDHAQPSQQTVCSSLPMQLPLQHYGTLLSTPLVNAPRFRSNSSAHAQTNAFNEQEVPQQVSRQQRAVTDHAQPSKQKLFRSAMPPPVNVPRFRSTESAVGQVESNSSVRAQTQTNTFNEQEVSQQLSRQEVVLTSHAQPFQQTVGTKKIQMPPHFQSRRITQRRMTQDEPLRVLSDMPLLSPKPKEPQQQCSSAEQPVLPPIPTLQKRPMLHNQTKLFTAQYQPYPIAIPKQQQSVQQTPHEPQQSVPLQHPHTLQQPFQPKEEESASMQQPTPRITQIIPIRRLYRHTGPLQPITFRRQSQIPNRRQSYIPVRRLSTPIENHLTNEENVNAQQWEANLQQNITQAQQQAQHIYTPLYQTNGNNGIATPENYQPRLQQNSMWILPERQCSQPTTGEHS